MVARRVGFGPGLGNCAEMQLATSASVRVSIAAPAYNEAAGIESTVTGWLGYLSSAPRVSEFEIVVCNDGSHDNTGPILDRLSSIHTQVRPVQFEQNVGAAAALRAAIRATRFEWVLLIDSDGQFNIADLDRLLDAAEREGALAAMGIRKKADGFVARLGSWGSGRLCSAIHGAKLTDFNSAFKLVSGPVLRGLTLEAIGLNYSTEVTSRLLEKNIRMVEVEIDHRPRSTGISSARLFRTASHRFAFVVYIWLRQRLINARIIEA